MEIISEADKDNPLVSSVPFVFGYRPPNFSLSKRSACPDTRAVWGTLKIRVRACTRDENKATRIRLLGPNIRPFLPRGERTASAARAAFDARRPGFCVLPILIGPDRERKLRTVSGIL